MARSPAIVLSASLLTGCSGSAANTAPAPIPPPTAVAAAPLASAAESAEPPAPSALTLRAGRPPAALAIDGALTEWAGTPPALARDGLRLWIAVGEQGIVLAGEVAVAPGSAPTSLPVTVTVPVPTLPPLGYLRQWDFQKTDSDADCENVQTFGDPPEEQARAECRAWRVEQIDRRGAIRARFSRKAAVALRNSGRAFEGALPVADLPPLETAELERFDLSIELPSGTRVLAHVTLDPPLRLLPEGSLAAALLGSDIKGENVVAVHQPGRPDEIRYFFNEARGYQGRPQTPSPDEHVVALGKRKPVVAFGDVVVETLGEVWPPVALRRQDALITRVGDRVVEVADLGEHAVSGVLRRSADTADLVLTYVGRYNTFGGGTCGACPVALLNVQKVRADGTLEKPWWHEEVGGGPPVMHEPTEAGASKDGRRIVVRGDRIEQTERRDGTTESHVSGGFEITWTWDPQKGDYGDRKERALPRTKNKKQR